MLMIILYLSAGAIIGFIICAMLVAASDADLRMTAGAANSRAIQLERANGVLRRELTELRATYEPTRDHGYGKTNG